MLRLTKTVEAYKKHCVVSHSTNKNRYYQAIKLRCRHQISKVWSGEGDDSCKVPSVQIWGREHATQGRSSVNRGWARAVFDWFAVCPAAVVWRAPVPTECMET